MSQPRMSQPLQGRRVAFLVAPEGIEQIELTEPWKAVEQAGGTPELISVRSGTVQAFRHLDKADTFPVDHVVTEANVDDYIGLALPGGVANPDLLRTVPDAVRFVADFGARGKPIAAICHAPWMLIDADLVRGRRVTSWPSLRTDLVNAGADWVDQQVVVDRDVVTSRNPDDLPAFNEQLVATFSAAAQPERAQTGA